MTQYTTEAGSDRHARRVDQAEDQSNDHHIVGAATAWDVSANGPDGHNPGFWID
ncbi:hypothetical protein [Polaromonas vacuolata]|uniref:hypothetical protein n=1 Tax=Polaromonas vacuolata TaxID=37448 RepID=UPI001457899A|nr:hypothetical protein [Polaromonas vacuolata]